MSLKRLGREVLDWAGGCIRSAYERREEMDAVGLTTLIRRGSVGAVIASWSSIDSAMSILGKLDLIEASQPTRLPENHRGIPAYAINDGVRADASLDLFNN